jgi:hypothetical protein
MAIVKRVQNDTRERATLRHPMIASVEFAWRDGESLVMVLFDPVKKDSCPYWLTCGLKLEADRPQMVGVNLARNMWDEFVRQGWEDAP